LSQAAGIFPRKRDKVAKQMSLVAAADPLQPDNSV
jgi:hypothetical protein